MKSITKLIAVLLISAMTISMTACSKKQTPTVAPNVDKSQSSEIDSLSDLSTTLSSQTSNNSSTKQEPQSASSGGTTYSTRIISNSKSYSPSVSTKSGSANTTTTTVSKSSMVSHSTGSTSGKSTASTYTPPKQTASTAPTKPNSSTTNTTSQASKPKTAYDRPFDATKIRNDMIAYGESKGLILNTSLWVKSDFSTNAGYDPGMDTRDVDNSTLFAQFCKDDIDNTIAGIKVTEPTAKNSDISFNVVLLPISGSPGDYYIFVLYG